MAMKVQIVTDAGIQRMLDRLVNPDLRHAMVRCEAIITEDHTKANLEGIDKDGISYRPVTYRNDSGVVAVAKRNKYNRGVGPALEGAGDNLSSAEYRRLKGPPLAPRFKSSRIIANFVTMSGQNPDGTWFVRSALLGIVSKKGVPFMLAHFEGRGRLPRRDDRGIRPWGIAECRKASREELLKIVRGEGR
jgi:hypothetical protein